MVCSPELDRTGQERFRDPQCIREAFESGRLRLYGQPVLDLRSNRVSQYELSLRLQPEGDDLISPAALLAAAERSDVMHAIDHWLVGHAIGLLKHSRERGRAHQVSVNLSSMAPFDGNLVPAIQRELLDAAVDPRRLVLELREQAALADVDRTGAFVDAAKGLGCRVALDHFGVGFYSLSYLKRLPVDYLKIDEHLIRDLRSDRVDRHLVEAIVEVSRVLGPQTVGEGVGDGDTVRLLQECGVDFAQGPGVGQPRPIAELLPAG